MITSPVFLSLLVVYLSLFWESCLAQISPAEKYVGLLPLLFFSFYALSLVGRVEATAATTSLLFAVLATVASGQNFPESSIFLKMLSSLLACINKTLMMRNMRCCYHKQT